MHAPLNRNSMPTGPLATHNLQMANQINASPVFDAVAKEVQHDRELTAMRYNYTYTLSDSIVGQQTLPFFITIEQGTDFSCKWMLGSAFSYDAENDTDFPIPNSIGATAWAGRGLSVQITDTRSGRNLTSGFVTWETLLTPGYGLNFQQPYPFRYHFYRNTKIRFDIRNRDNADRTHYFEIQLNGFKVVTPN
jgi:hypothetical protein